MPTVSTTILDISRRISVCDAADSRCGDLRETRRFREPGARLTWDDLCAICQLGPIRPSSRRCFLRLIWMVCVLSDPARNVALECVRAWRKRPLLLPSFERVVTGCRECDHARFLACLLQVARAHSRVSARAGVRALTCCLYVHARMSVHYASVHLNVLCMHVSRCVRYLYACLCASARVFSRV